MSKERDLISNVYKNIVCLSNNGDSPLKDKTDINMMSVINIVCDGVYKNIVCLSNNGDSPLKDKTDINMMSVINIVCDGDFFV